MTEPGLIVVGSGPAGVSAAEAFRRHDSERSVTILTEDPALPYARPPLSKEFLRGAETSVDLHPASWYADRDIELVRGVAVQAVDTAERVVAAGGNRYPYRSLVLACGAAPAPLPVADGGTAHQLRSLASGVALRDDAGQAASAVVIGAGFIGCEAAASLALRGLATTLVAPDPVPQAKRLGIEAGHRMLDVLQSAGVRYAGGVQVTGVEHGAVRLDNGVTVDTDLVLAATGVHPQTALAEQAGLRIAQRRIAVDERMRTDVPDVYAAGDAALAHNATAGRPIAVEHWQDAVDQGEVAGANAAGESMTWDGVPGFWTTIGEATLKYHAWGDGYQHSRLIEHNGGFTVWYESDGVLVGVLTMNADDDYDDGERLITAGRPAPVAMRG